MNIKNLIGSNNLISPAGSSSKVERTIKTDSSNERDANGQQFYQKEKQKEKMTQEQFNKALAILREKSFIKEMNWNVVSFSENDVKYAWVQASSGESIRKISEYDLWEMFSEINNSETKGQLLKKTA